MDETMNETNRNGGLMETDEGFVVVEMPSAGDIEDGIRCAIINNSMIEGDFDDSLIFPEIEEVRETKSGYVAITYPNESGERRAFAITVNEVDVPKDLK